MTDTSKASERPSDLVECCREMLEWSKTGLLNGGSGGAVRARAAALDPRIPDHSRLSVAESGIKDDAIRFVVSRDSLLEQAIEALRKIVDDVKRGSEIDGSILTQFSALSRIEVTARDFLTAYEQSGRV